MLVFPCLFLYLRVLKKLNFFENNLVIIVKQLFHLFQLQHLTLPDRSTMFIFTLLAKTGEFELLDIVLVNWLLGAAVIATNGLEGHVGLDLK
jgi:hypothetical protein